MNKISDASCKNCGSIIYSGLAKCEKCQQIKESYINHATIIADKKGFCAFSGAPTDVRLPNGHYIWAPYLLDFLNAGWLDENYFYTEEFYQHYPHLKK
jgi:hypothetical protein